MNKHYTGRLDRFHYWILVVGYVCLRLTLHLLGDSNFAIALDLLGLCILMARGHDFDMPGWLTLVLWTVCCVVLPVTVLLQSNDFGLARSADLLQRLSPTMTLLMIAPGNLLFIVIGLVGSTADVNEYGPTGQGFRGLNRYRGESAQPQSPMARRTEMALTRR
jgi:uncharacterized membrane protein YhaH (DUF805 family)